MFQNHLIQMLLSTFTANQNFPYISFGEALEMHVALQPFPELVLDTHVCCCHLYCHMDAFVLRTEKSTFNFFAVFQDSVQLVYTINVRYDKD